MIIAIPMDENKKDICASFGRAPFFLFYDTEKKDYKFISNSASDAQGGAGIKAAQLIVDHQANALITVRCGENAAEVLKAANINIYKAEVINAEENLKAFAENSLAILTHFHAGFQGLHGTQA